MLRLVPLLLVLLTGCHAKFKKYAPTLGEVKIQVVNTGGPYVQLGKVYTEQPNLLADVVNVVQDVRSLGLTDRIARAVQVASVNEALAAGYVETMGSGPPFGTSPDAKALLQLEVESYGMYVPYLGAPGEFTYTARAVVYKADGERIYRKRLTCTAGVGDPNLAAVVLGAVNNAKQLEQLTDEQINAIFVDTARWCGSRFVLKMRQHAG